MEMDMSEEVAPGVGATEAGGAEAAETHDPVMAALSDEEFAETALEVRSKARWHARNGADKVAAQLQIGRGRSKEDVAKAFGIGLSTLTGWVNRGEWSSKLGEQRRRVLARRVWAVGLFRLQQGEDVDLEVLKASAEWRALPTPRPQPGPRQDFHTFLNSLPTGGRQTSMDNGNDGHDEADPERDTRNYFRRRLDEIIAEIEASAAEEADGEAAGEVDRSSGDAGDPGRG
jgi:transposase